MTESDLDKEWNTVEAANDDSVMYISCEDVKSSDSSLDQLLHANPVHVRALRQTVRSQLTNAQLHTPHSNTVSVSTTSHNVNSSHSTFHYLVIVYFVYVVLHILASVLSVD